MDYNVLILGPGGNKGTVELGFLQYCKIKNYLDGIKTIAAVSVGTIIGLLYICGYSIEEIYAEALKSDILDIKQLNSIEDIISSCGLMNNNNIKEKLEKLVRNKFGICPTMSGLYASTGIEFMIVASNIKSTLEKPNSSPVYITYKTQPNLSCVDAVLMSCNIPGLFSKLEYDNMLIADGALTNPYPVDQYDDGINKILGISLIGIPSGEGFFDYLLLSINAPMAQIRERIQKASSDKVTHVNIKVPQKTISVFSNEKAGYYIHGYDFARKFFEKHNGGIYLKDQRINYDN